MPRYQNRRHGPAARVAPHFILYLARQSAIHPGAPTDANQPASKHRAGYYPEVSNVLAPEVDQAALAAPETRRINLD